MMVDGEKGGSPAGKVRRPWMKIIGAKPKVIEDVRRDDHIRREGDEPCAPEQFWFKRPHIAQSQNGACG
jgi:hypothetical protein